MQLFIRLDVLNERNKTTVLDIQLNKLINRVVFH